MTSLAGRDNPAMCHGAIVVPEDVAGASQQSRLGQGFLPRPSLGKPGASLDCDAPARRSLPEQAAQELRLRVRDPRATSASVRPRRRPPERSAHRHAKGLVKHTRT